MKHYNGPAGWISATIRTPQPGGFAWKINAAVARLHVRVFQLTGGRIAGTLDGAPLLVLHHTGAKTGARRQNPTIYMPDGENFVVVASIAGNPKNPAWYHNLRAHPTLSRSTSAAAVAASGRARRRARKPLSCGRVSSRRTHPTRPT